MAVCKKASPLQARMTQQNVKSAANAPLSERRHSDPPALWVTVFLSSIVLHLFVFGTLRLWLTIRVNSFQASTELIPVDVIAVASQAPSPRQPAPTIASVATPNPSSVNTPRRTANQSSNRQISSTSTRVASQQTRTQQGTGNLSPSAQQSPTERTSPTTKPAENPSRGTPTPIASSAPNPSPNKQPGTPTPPTGSNSTPDGGTQPGDTKTPPPSKPIPPTGGSEGGQNPSGSEQGDGFQASAPSPLVIWGSLNDEPNKLATLKVTRGDFPPDSYVAKLASSLDQVLVLEVFLLIDRTGKPKIEKVESVMPAPQGSSSVNLTKLAEAIIQNWEFEPTLNKQGQAFDQTYQLSLKIAPRRK